MGIRRTRTRLSPTLTVADGEPPFFSPLSLSAIMDAADANYTKVLRSDQVDGGNYTPFSCKMTFELLRL